LEIYNKNSNKDIDIGNYKLNRSDYEQLSNYHKFLSETSDKNSVVSQSTNNNKNSIIYSPYFYIPCIIVATVGSGYIIYYYDIDYLSYITPISLILKKRFKTL
jgi:hypothetical protein